MPRRWSIQTKLLIGLGLLAVIVGTLSWGGIHGLYAYREIVRSLSRRVTELPLANEFGQRVSNLRVSLSRIRPSYSMLDEGPNTPLSLTRLELVEFTDNLLAAEELLARYRAKVAENPDRTGSIIDSRHEFEAVREMQATLADLRNAAQKGELLDDDGYERSDRRLVELQDQAGKLPGFLYENIIKFTDDARAEYRTLIVLAWFTSVTTGILVALLVVLFYRWLFRPLKVLIKGSRKVAGGQFQYRIRLETDDEMSELAEAMNGMTERFQAIRDDLDRQVQERTRQVVRSEQLASVGFLAAGVAHEINNPLASIAMCAESLESRLAEAPPQDDEQGRVLRHYLQLIQTEAFRCKEITERLLDFSRLGDHKRQPADIRELLAGVIDMLGHLGKYQGKHVHFVAGDPVVAAVNSQEIKQVVLNLLTNALDSVDLGGIVTVQLAARDECVDLEIADNGCGMSEEVQKHLFEPFFTRRRGGQGTGLGLSIVYRIVADHDGTIEATSDGVGRGSRFWVRLPRGTRSLDSKETSHRYQAA